MIQSNELRIGNLLQDKISKNFLKVVELNEKDVITYVIDRSKFPLSPGWSLEPIPLTEDILLMCGFKEEKSYNLIKRYSRFEDEYVSFICAEYNEFMKRWIICAGNDNTIHVVALNSFEYLHQLQNLFYSLTEEELLLQP